LFTLCIVIPTLYFNLYFSKNYSLRLLFIQLPLELVASVLVTGVLSGTEDGELLVLLLDELPEDGVDEGAEVVVEALEELGVVIPEEFGSIASSTSPPCILQGIS
jgi:hypothetical protein